MAYHKNAPLGVVVNDELVGSEVMVALRGTKVIFNSDSEAALGGVDVVAGPDAGIVVVTEADAIMMDTDALRKRFTLLTKYFHRMVLVMKSDVSNIGSQQVEEMASCEFLLSALPCFSADEAARLIKAMSDQMQTRSSKAKRAAPSGKRSLQKAIKSINGVGQQKADELSRQFGSFSKLADAPRDSLVLVAGSAGNKVRDFLDQSM